MANNHINNFQKTLEWVIQNEELTKVRQTKYKMSYTGPIKMEIGDVVFYIKISYNGDQISGSQNEPTILLCGNKTHNIGALVFDLEHGIESMSVQKECNVKYGGGYSWTRSFKLCSSSEQLNNWSQIKVIVKINILKVFNRKNERIDDKNKWSKYFYDTKIVEMKENNNNTNNNNELRNEVNQLKKK
eukprot:490324_1